MFNQRPFKRSERIGDKIKIIISDILLKNINIINKGLITITKVDISRDLRYAKIFFSHIDTNHSSEELQIILNENKNKIKFYLGNNLDNKYVPEIEFTKMNKSCSSLRTLTPDSSSFFIVYYFLAHGTLY